MIKSQIIPDTAAAADALREGGVIVFPTDTIWGLGCDALNQDATDRVYEIKNRPREKPCILMVASLDMLLDYVPKIHPRLQTLLAFHTRPLTVIHNPPNGLPPFACSPDGSAAVRITFDPFCKAIIKMLGRPIISTSANVSEKPAPANFGQISSTILNQADYVVQYRQDCQVDSMPSPIVKVTRKAELVFIRE